MQYTGQDMHVTNTTAVYNQTSNKIILIWGGLGKKIRVPDGIWTHKPPWSSRML